VFINDSNVSNNAGDNIRVGYAANSWRIRDGLVGQASRWGINVLGPGEADRSRWRPRRSWTLATTCSSTVYAV
jgi:hypothetical protein